MNKVIIITGTRKRAIARATARAGSGRVKINGIDINAFTPALVRERIKEPLILAEGLLGKVDVDIVTNGGGINSQAEAARLAAAKVIVEFTKDKKIKESYLNYDRHLLVADVRRKETRKPNCHSKARAKRQKSYR